jgi:hypothetical protein
VLVVLAVPRVLCSSIVETRRTISTIGTFSTAPLAPSAPLAPHP